MLAATLAILLGAWAVFERKQRATIRRSMELDIKALEDQLSLTKAYLEDSMYEATKQRLRARVAEEDAELKDLKRRFDAKFK
jgi:hypothetical protein